VLCCAVLCCAVLCCAVLCCAVLCCAVLCCAVLSVLSVVMLLQCWVVESFQTRTCVRDDRKCLQGVCGDHPGVHVTDPEAVTGASSLHSMRH